METKLPHIRISKPVDSIGFTTSKSGGGEAHYPKRPRGRHGALIKEKLEAAWAESKSEKVAIHSVRTGTYIEFQSSPDFDIKIKSLEDLNQGIRLCNVREEKAKQADGSELTTKYITVYVPNDKKNWLAKKVDSYLEQDKGAYFKLPKFSQFENIRKEMKIGKSGIKEENGDLVVYITANKQEGFFKAAEQHVEGIDEYQVPIERVPKNNELVNGIEELRTALLVESFWTDDKRLIPTSQQEWCEVWLRGDDEAVITKFDDLLKSKNIESKVGYIKFPERFVKIIHAAENQLSDITKNSDDIAEYRRAKTTAEFLLSQNPAEQSKWVDSLVERVSVDNSSNVSVCILDTGVNNGHPLLDPVLLDEDCQTFDPTWGTHDHHSHGTLMAGLAAYGDLQSKLESSDSIKLGHILESVKILPPKGKNKVELYGYITKQAISLAEVQAQGRKRIACMPVSSEDTRDRGKPSSWSAAIDQITSGAEDEDKRLFILSAGNITDQNQIANYPDSLMTDSIHDPAQSWNAVTVGAFTELTNITDSTLSDYSVLASAGEISPFSTTSLTWENNKWPIKPEVVFEGGNVAVNTNEFATECNDLSLVSTYYKPQEESLYPFNMTSAATAQAANFAAQIQVQYPNYWPETIRALMIHSAEWPQALKKQFAQNDSKTELKNVLRACGYGVPNLERAIYCASNSLTLIAEAEIQPFENSKTKDMHLYSLPWPKEILENLGESDIEMRITLSYFIEPGPGEIGWKDRYRYASHGLRFDLNSPGEDKDTFIKRINTKSREENEERPGTQSPSGYWVIGSQNRDKGSIHSDIWRGSAVDLADSNLISVSPVIGWWRERKHLGKSNKITRYSLIVSITTPEQNVDIYTPVKIAAEIKPSIEVRS
ncbi:MAG: hypothetical protein ACI9AT_000274 [Ulvibacter sp.]|jgi:hypothetical protein